MTVLKGGKYKRVPTKTKSIITEDTLGDVLAKATHIAVSLSNKIFEIDPNALPVDLKEKIETSAVSEVKTTEEKVEEKEEEKEEEEKEDLGIGGLFD